MRRPAQPPATPIASPPGVFITPPTCCYRRVMASLRWVCASLRHPPSGVAGSLRSPFECPSPRVPSPEGTGVSALPRRRSRAIAPPLSIATIANTKKIHHAAQNNKRHKKNTPCGTQRRHNPHFNGTPRNKKKGRAPALKCATISKIPSQGCLDDAF